MKKKFRYASFVMVFFGTFHITLNNLCYVASASRYAYEKDSYWNGTLYKITDDDNFVYDEYENGIEIITYVGSYSTNISIPSEIDNKKVLKIGDRSFTGKEGIEKITLPDTITEIGQDAFSGCLNLKNINLPKGLIKLGSSSFKDCIALENIELPNSLSLIDSHTFDGCTNLENVKIPNSIIQIREYAFSSCNKIRNIEMSSISKGIGGGAFKGCTLLENVKINGGTLYIGKEAFSECESLKSVHLPNSISQIFQYAFSKCYNLEEINIPESVNEIQYGIFNGCKNLKNVKIPKSVTSIESSVFNDTDKCKFTISGVKNSYAYSFAKKNGLEFNDVQNDSSNNIYEGECKDIILDNNNLIEYNKIGNNISTNIISENYEKNNNNWYKEMLINSILADNDYDISKINEQIKELPTSLVEKIYDSPLKIYLQSKEDFDSNVSYEEELENNTIAFYTPATTGIYLNNEEQNKEGVLIHEIGHFYDSYILSDKNKSYYSEKSDDFLNIFNLEEKNELLGDTSTHYTNNIKEYFAEMFKYYFIYRDTLKEKAPNTFAFMDNLLKEYDDDTNYKNHNWNKKNNVNSDNEKDDDFDYLKDEAGITICSYKGNNSEVVIPDTIDNIPVVKIKENAFERNNNIVSVKLPDSLTEIGSFAFYGCENIKFINMPKSLTDIGVCAFNSCLSLENIKIPEGVTSIKNQTFSKCKSLKKVMLPNSLSIIEGNAFEKCTSLEEIKLPKKVTKICNNVFNGCSKLENIDLPRDIENISESAFLNCNSNLTINGCKGSYAYIFALKNKYNFNNTSENPIEVLFEGNYKVLVLDNNKLKQYNLDGYLIESTILDEEFVNDYTTENINKYKKLLFNSMIIDNYSNGNNNYDLKGLNKEIEVLPQLLIEKIYDSNLKIYLKSEKDFTDLLKYEDLSEDTIAFYSSKNNTMHFSKLSMRKEGVYIHEIGHFFDCFILENNTGKAFSESNSDFLSIFNKEKNNLFSEDEHYYRDNVKEYFAECFKYYYIYRDTLKEKAPKTYEYFYGLLKNYKDSSIDHNWNNSSSDNDDKIQDEDKIEEDNKTQNNTSNSSDNESLMPLLIFAVTASILRALKKEG